MFGSKNRWARRLDLYRSHSIYKKYFKSSILVYKRKLSLFYLFVYLFMFLCWCVSKLGRGGTGEAFPLYVFNIFVISFALPISLT